MRDEDKTKEELIEELQEMRRRVCKLMKSEVRGQNSDTRGGSNLFNIGADFTRDRKAEAPLQESIDTIEALLNATRDMVYLIDPDGTIIVANHRGAEFLGGSHHKLIGGSIFDFLPPKLATERREKLDEVIRLGRPLIFEDKHYVSYFENSFYPILGTEGVQGIAIYSRDITNKKRAEKALKESKEKYKRLIEMMNEGLWVLNEDGVVSFVNDRLCEMLGCSAKEMIGHRVADFLDEPNLKKLEDRTDTRGRQGAPSCEIEWSCKDGRRVWTIVAPSLLYDAEGVFLGSFGVITDITDRKQAEEALTKARDELEERVNERTAELLRANEQLAQEITDRKKVEDSLRRSDERFRSLIDQAADAIFVHDFDGRFLEVNRQACTSLGYTRDELLSMSVSDVDPDALARGDSSKFWPNLPATFEARHRRQDGAMFPVEIRLGAIEYGETRLLLGTVRDLTDRKRADKERETLRAQLLQAQKMEAIGTLTGGIAHDFNNLLTIMNGYAEFILSEKTEDDPICSDLRKILETGRRGAEMVQRLLGFSKKAEINPRPLDLNSIVEDAINLMERTFPKMIEVETTLAKDLCQVNGDPGQLEQVLMNLCINAKEAMPDGGCLRIETKNLAVDEAYCAGHVGAKPGPYVLIEVSDTGSGMSEETIERTFDPFFTTKGWDFNKGTGLGLSVSKGIVEQHGGWITCQSEPGVGTTFTVYFPSIETQPEHKKPEIETTATTEDKKILLVDDEEYVRDLGKRILQRAGYPVITASNGEEALEIYAREHSSISLVLLDFIMPQMAGEKCLEELSKINPQAKVLIASGFTVTGDAKNLLDAKSRGILPKPFNIRELLRSVRDVLDGP